MKGEPEGGYERETKHGIKMKGLRERVGKVGTRGDRKEGEREE